MPKLNVRLEGLIDPLCSIVASRFDREANSDPNQLNQVLLFGD